MEDSPPPTFMQSVQAALQRRYQRYIDQSVPWTKTRWATYFSLMLLFSLRVVIGHGWYIVAYALGIFALNKFISFISPLVDPETEGPVLPSKEGEEFKPFVRQLPEFKFWLALMKATLLALLASTTRLFDIPVFWPILLAYFLVLFGLTINQRIKHMRQHGYVPWDLGKRVFSKGKSDGDGKASEKKPKQAAD